MSAKHLRTTVSAVCLLGLVLGLLCLAGPAQADARRKALWRCGDTRFIAHRGSVDRTRIENTLRSFGHAAYAGAGTIETDLHLTADRQWVVMHDDSVDRTTYGTGLVSDLTLAQIKAIRTNDGVVGGIPTLAQTLAFVRSKPRLRLEVEIKDTGSDDDTLRDFSRLVHQYGLTERVRVTSFGQPLLTRLHELDPTLHRAVVTGTQMDPGQVRLFGTTLVLAAQASSPGYLALLRANGVRVEVWTVDRPTGWSSAVRSRADFVITDLGPAFNHYCWYGA